MTRYLDYKINVKEYQKLPIVINWLNTKSCPMLEKDLYNLSYRMRVYYMPDRPQIKEIEIYSVEGKTPHITYKRDRFKDLFNMLSHELNYFYEVERKEVVEVVNSPFSLLGKGKTFSIRYNKNYFCPHVSVNATLNTIEIAPNYTRINNMIWLLDKPLKDYFCYMVDINSLKIIKEYNRERSEMKIIEPGLIARINNVIKKMHIISEFYYKSEINILTKLLSDLT